MPVTTFQIFQAAERLELAAAELYGVVRTRLAWGEPEARLLERLEQEEQQHAARLRMLGSQYRHQPRLFDLRSIPLEQLRAAEVSMAALQAEVASGRWDSEPRGLLEQLVREEEATACTHADVLAAHAAPHLAQFFRELARQDRGHRALLDGLLQATR